MEFRTKQIIFVLKTARKFDLNLKLKHSFLYIDFNTLCTGDADLRLYITTVQGG